MTGQGHPGRNRSFIDTVASYGVMGLARLIRDVVLTRILNSTARIVRRPVYIRGRRHIHFGQALTVGVGLRIDAFPQRPDAGVLIRFGSRIELNDHVHIAAVEQVMIGDDTLIASRVFISDHNHGDPAAGGAANAVDTAPARRPLVSRPVAIGARVWIGEGAMILPGVNIGDGAIIGGGAIVTRDVGAGCIAVGSPARTIKCYDAATQRWLPV